MSRSYKKHPSINYVCYFSNKEDKKQANRKMRRVNKQIIKDNMSYSKELDFDDWGDGWYYYPIELHLDNSDFKKLREVSNTYNFASDGLPGVVNEYALIRDFSDPNYTWMNRNNYPITSIDEARREHNWALLKHYIGK